MRILREVVAHLESRDPHDRVCRGDRGLRRLLRRRTMARACSTCGVTPRLVGAVRGMRRSVSPSGHCRPRASRTGSKRHPWPIFAGCSGSTQYATGAVNSPPTAFLFERRRRHRAPGLRRHRTCSPQVGPNHSLLALWPKRPFYRQWAPRARWHRLIRRVGVGGGDARSVARCPGFGHCAGSGRDARTGGASAPTTPHAGGSRGRNPLPTGADSTSRRDCSRSGRSARHQGIRRRPSRRRRSELLFTSRITLRFPLR